MRHPIRGIKNVFKRWEWAWRHWMSSVSLLWSSPCMCQHFQFLTFLVYMYICTVQNTLEQTFFQWISEQTVFNSLMPPPHPIFNMEFPMTVGLSEWDLIHMFIWAYDISLIHDIPFQLWLWAMWSRLDYHQSQFPKMKLLSAMHSDCMQYERSRLLTLHLYK